MRLKTALNFALLLIIATIIVRAVEENLEILKRDFFVFGIPFKLSTALIFSLLFGLLSFTVIAAGLGLNRFLSYVFLKFKERANRESETRYLKGMDAILGGRPVEAIKHFKEAIALNPHSLPALIKIGDAMRETGNTDQAIEWHKKALIENPKHLQALYAIAEDYLKKGNVEEAKRWLEEIISLQPKRALHALRLLRNIYIKETNWHKAKEIQEKILKASVLEEEIKEDESYTISIDYEIYSYLLSQNKIDESILGLESLKRNFPNFLPTYIKLAEALLLSGDEAGAIQNYKEGFINCDSIAPLLLMEKLLLEKGEPQSCIKEYEEIILNSKRSSLPKFLLGRLLLKQGFYQKAEAIFNELESQFSPTPSLEYHLAKINERREEYLRACSHFNEMWRLMKPSEFLFVCNSCKAEETFWKDFCTNCGKWNTFVSTLEKELNFELTPPEPIYYKKSAWID
ncbi:MAG: tetratricopeptide repeat protein [Acidobacteria bacterium]|nr:tetratricopeptide repeat protein [Acidobacteriota bacterium]